MAALRARGTCIDLRRRRLACYGDPRLMQELLQISRVRGTTLITTASSTETQQNRHLDEHQQGNLRAKVG